MLTVAVELVVGVVAIAAAGLLALQAWDEQQRTWHRDRKP